MSHAAEGFAAISRYADARSRASAFFAEIYYMAALRMTLRGY
jgi:hypothetical protein